MPSGKLKIDIRRQKILDILRQEGKVTVIDLTKRMGTTAVTIRNDLDSLAQEGRLERVSGGAIVSNHAINTWVGNPRDKYSCEKEKKAIAQKVLEYINDGDTIFINSGTTSLFVAEALKQYKYLKIVTNSLAVAHSLSNCATIRVILLGGELNSDYGFTYGGDAIEQLKRYQSAWCILSVDGVDLKGDITTCHSEEAMIDNVMVERAGKSIVVADHQKIGCAGFARVYGMDSYYILITDNSCECNALEKIRANGVTVCLADN